MQFKLNDPVCVVEFGKPTVYGKIAGVYVSEGEPSGYKVEVAADGDGLPSFIHASASHIVPTGALSFPALTEKPSSALSVQEGGDHYRTLKIQPIEYIHANGIPFAEGCVIKYVTRWRGKNGLADLKKARHFIDLLIELEEKQNG
jgi:hypothetical protein